MDNETETTRLLGCVYRVYWGYRDIGVCRDYWDVDRGCWCYTGIIAVCIGATIRTHASIPY